MASFDNMNVAALKKACKEAGVVGSGEKPDLIKRLKQAEMGKTCTLDGENPATLKAGPLKKALATRGLPCSLDLEDRDTLVGRLIDALKDEQGGAGGGAAAAGGGEDDAVALAVNIAKQVLELGDGGDPEGVLSLLGDAITRTTPFAKQRRAYLSLAKLIHPDKLSKAFDGATRAFQAPPPPPRLAGPRTPSLQPQQHLRSTADDASPGAGARACVRRADRARGAEQRRQGEGERRLAGGASHQGKQTRSRHECERALRDAMPCSLRCSQAKAIARSNHNCQRTRVFCPRCSAEWATADSGCADYFYNFMMQGLKLYCCALCLCEFGCVSATHKCAPPSARPRRTIPSPRRALHALTLAPPTPHRPSPPSCLLRAPRRRRCPYCRKPFPYHPQDYHRQVDSIA
jgi:hypothetical protein